VFLGTGGGRFAVNKQLRSSGGIILRVNGIQFHIDPGPGALVKAQQYGINLRANNVLLCTHAHLDHCNDVNAVIDAMTHGGIDKSGILLASKSVIYGHDGERPYLTKSHRSYIDKYMALEVGNDVQFGKSIELKTLKAQHRDSTAIGFKFFTPKFVLSYTGDTGFFGDLIDELRNSDILILNTLKPFGHKSDDHLSSDDVVKILKEVNPRIAIIQHFGQKMLEMNPIYQAREIEKQSGVQVIAANDGLAIDLLNYSFSMKHKTLNLY